jgi:hypothetical protein
VSHRRPLDGDRPGGDGRTDIEILAVSPSQAAREPAATILHAKSQNMARAKRLASSQGRTLSKRLTRTPTLAAASEMTHAGRCSLSPALRQRECLE